MISPFYEFMHQNQRLKLNSQFRNSRNQSKNQRKQKLSKALRAVILSSILGCISMQSAYAGTTTADFLTWERRAQESFLQVSISMAGIFAAQVRPNIARCIDDWYFKNDVVKEQRNTEMLKDMPSYADYHPNAVVLGFIQQACGDIKTDN